MQKVITEFISAEALTEGKHESSNNWSLRAKSVLIEHKDIDPYLKDGYKIDQTFVTPIGTYILAVTYILLKDIS